MHVLRRAVAGVWLAAVLAAAGCGKQPGLAELPVREFTGHYVAGEAASWFRPCGGAAADPAWWVTFTDRSVEQAERAWASGQLQTGMPSFVRWAASVTMGGEVGPQGPGVPALLVRDILDVRPAAQGDCDGTGGSR
jgi:hypothetical protein